MNQTPPTSDILYATDTQKVIQTLCDHSQGSSHKDRVPVVYNRHYGRLQAVEECDNCGKDLEVGAIIDLSPPLQQFQINGRYCDTHGLPYVLNEMLTQHHREIMELTMKVRELEARLNAIV